MSIEDSIVQISNLQNSDNNGYPYFSFANQQSSIQQDWMYKTTKVIVIKHDSHDTAKDKPIDQLRVRPCPEKCPHFKTPVCEHHMNHQNRTKDTKMELKAMMEIDSMSMEEDKDQMIVILLLILIFAMFR